MTFSKSAGHTKNAVAQEHALIISAAVALLLTTPSALAGQDGASDAELFSLGSAQYYELQKYMVAECASRHGLNASDLHAQFSKRYGDFFEAKIGEAQRFFAEYGQPYSRFVQETMKYPSQMISVELCSQLPAAIRSRINDVKVVERGIATQVEGLQGLKRLRR